MATIEVTVPDIGDSDEVDVIEVLVKPGDVVKAEQSLITLESDKASMEVPSSAAGTVKELKVKIGDKVKQGTLIAVLEGEGEAGAPAPVAAAPASAAPAPAAAAESPAAAPAPAPAASPASAAAPASAGGRIEVRVPDIGDSHDVEVIELLVKPGDSIKAEQSLITLESDKASMEIPAPQSGTLIELKVKIGDKVNTGDVIGVLEGAASNAPAPAAAAPAPAAAASAPAESQAAPTTVSAPAAPIEKRPAPVQDDALPLGRKPHASPVIRKFARELGVELVEVAGTGPHGRITREDVQGWVKGALAGKAAAGPGKPASTGGGSGFGAGWPAWPSLDFSKFGATETLALSRIKKLSGPNLARNWATIPHVTQFDEADVTELEEFRKVANDGFAKKAGKDGKAPKVTMLAFVMKACITALKEFPAVNSSLDATGENLILKQYWHIGFAADTPNGLVVPVLRDVDKKGVAQIATETGALAAKARDGKLSPADMSGASFTISSLGGIGGTLFTPIINAPEVAILGLSRSEIKPRWDGQTFQPRLMLPLSFSYDHRVIDGAQAARFTTYLSEVLSDMRRTLL